MTDRTWKILFVDDEPAVLDGLKNLLRRDRHRWSMSFCESGAEALKKMQELAPDVVVSDMRMPGMDGAEFLAQVKQRFPGSARLVLSGFAERDAVLRAVKVAQQFLNKPCEADTLRAAVERACVLQQLLASPEVRKVAGSIERLPSLPSLYQQLSELANSPDSGMSQVASVLERDPAMSSKVLQLVNSAFFGCAQPIATVQHAASYLGIDLIKGLVLTAEVFSALGGGDAEQVARVQQAAVASARLAKAFLERSPHAGDAMTAALLHDVGRLVLAAGAPELDRACQAHPDRASRPRVEIEREVFGATHAELGAYLLGMWGLPFAIVEAVAHHHRPSLVARGDRSLLAAVHVASALADGDDDRLDLPFLAGAGLEAELPRWRALAQAPGQ